ncbi:MAG: glycosyltransferase [Gammaproteobacteria bacterium]|nr:MAG: glycosyltransferase [Gammaproteobacteria bacterium]
MNLSIVIPVFNEAENITALIDEIVATLDDESAYYIIVVDDGSTDDTASVLFRCAGRHAQVRVIRHRRRCGQSAAIATGVAAATTHWVVTLDGDGQNDPADIPILYAAMDRAADDIWLVAGYRKQRMDGWHKRVASRIANTTRGFLLQDQAPDSASGIKLFARETFLALPQFDHMHRFLPALVQRQGGQVLFITVNSRPRQHGRSKYGIFDRLWTGIIDLFGVMWLRRRSMRPEIEESQSSRAGRQNAPSHTGTPTSP